MMMSLRQILLRLSPAAIRYDIYYADADMPYHIIYMAFRLPLPAAYVIFATLPLHYLHAMRYDIHTL